LGLTGRGSWERVDNSKLTPSFKRVAKSSHHGLAATWQSRRNGRWQEAVVEVRSISREEFHRLYPYTGKMAAFIGEGAEWLTNDTRTVVGIITRHSIRPPWNYAVLTRDVLGDYQVTHIGKASNDLQTIREECRLAMTAEEPAPETDQKAGSVSPQEPLQYVQQSNKGPLVILMVLAGDIITIAFVLLWLIRCR
jgi:hypothetical protein